MHAIVNLQQYVYKITMEDLKELLDILFGNILEYGSGKIGKDKKILEIIGSLRSKGLLDQKFDINHRMNHKGMSYSLVNCKQEHCYECLVESLKNNIKVCEHNLEFTPYEKAHMNWIWDKYQAKLNS
jgi:hypothetical protein